MMFGFCSLQKKIMSEFDLFMTQRWMRANGNTMYNNLAQTYNRLHDMCVCNERVNEEEKEEDEKQQRRRRRSLILVSFRWWYEINWRPEMLIKMCD